MTPAATGTPSAAEMQVLSPLLAKLEPIQRQAVLDEWRLPTSDGSGFNRQGLLEARQLLLEAGFYYQDMKLYQPNGKLAQIEILMTGETMGRVLLPYIRNLKRLGFDATLRQVDGFWNNAETGMLKVAMRSSYILMYLIACYGQDII